MTDEKPDSQTTQGHADLVLPIIDRAREEVVWVRSAYKWAVSAVVIVILGGLFFSYRSIQDMKADLRKEGKQTQKQLTNEMQLQSRSLQQDLRDEVRQVREQVSQRLNQEFEREEITKLVKTTAQERIDSVANLLIEAQIQKLITPLRAELTQLIRTTSDGFYDSMRKFDLQLGESKEAESEIRLLLTEARKTLNQLREQSDFILTVLSAQSDDRDAYYKLLAWGSDESNSLRDQARRASDTVQRDYSGFMGDKPYRILQWPEGFDPSKMTFQQIKSHWQSLPSEFARAYVEFVWNHQAITKEEKLSFLQDVLRDSRNSLQAADKAARILADEAKVQYNPPFDFSQIEKWWKERPVPKTSPDAATDKSIGTGKQ